MNIHVKLYVYLPGVGAEVMVQRWWCIGGCAEMVVHRWWCKCGGADVVIRR